MIIEFHCGKTAITGNPVIGVTRRVEGKGKSQFVLDVYTSLSSLGFFSFEKTDSWEFESVEDARTRFAYIIREGC